MNKLKIIGGAFMVLSILLSLANILSVKITGAVVGVSIKSSVITILSLAFFLLGLLFLSSLEKKIIAGLLAVATIGGGTVYKINSDRERQYQTDIKITAPYWTDQGRFQRTYRWDKILDEVESKYSIPKGTLKGLAMRESYGDPLKLNAGRDGGAGLFMFQPRTAKHYGLKVYGNSDRSSADKKHGAELKELIKENDYDYAKMAKIDERFDIRKSAEAAAHYLKDDFKRYGSWDKALSAYNQGKPAPKPGETEHVKAIREYQKYYNQRDKRGKK